MSDKPQKQTNGFERKLLSGNREAYKWHITAASDSVRFRRDVKITGEQNQRTPVSASHYVLFWEAHNGVIVGFVYFYYI